MRYERYSKTGIPWLPEVPEGWDFLPLKSLFKSTFSGSWGADVAQGERGTVCYRMADFDYEHGVVSDSKLTYRSYKGSELQGKMLAVGDLLIEKSGGGDVSPVGRVVRVVSDRRATCSNFIQQVRCRDGINSSFVCYLFAALYARRLTRYYFNQTTGIQNLKVSRYLSVKVPMPSTIIQNAIVSFLDSKCGKIDRLVAAKEKEVALLKELKQSMIAEAVTRGVDHKSLKVPTGVFWQPRMPIGWSVKKCRHVLQKLSRPRPQDAELLVCTNKGTVNKRGDAKIGLVSDDETIYQGVAAGDLLIHGMDTWHGAIAVSEFDGMCTPVVHVCDSAENKAFVAYCFQNMARGKLFKLISNGVRQNTSDFRSWEKVARLPLVLPSRDEQDRIVAYIETRAAKIDAAVGKLEAEVAALKEYRERLVADVVTGQRKVAGSSRTNSGRMATSGEAR